MDLNRADRYKHANYKYTISQVLLQHVFYDYEAFFTRKLSKYIPYDAPFIAKTTISNMKLANQSIPALLIIDYVQ
jgi:hypothetical protein